VLFVVSFAFANAHLWWLPSSLQISDSTLVHLAQALLLAICGAALMRIQMIRFMNQLHTELVSASPQASRAYSKCFLKPTFTLLRNLIRALPMYIPMNGLDEIAAGSMVPQDVNLTTCHASVLFLDIVDYTKLIHSQSSSEDVKWVLHRVCEAFGKFADCVVENGGVVSCFMGDGMMCYFPSQSPSHILSDANKNRSCEERACAVALGCLQALEELCTKRWHCCLFRVRIGMSAGECYQGNFGAAGHRLSYTVVSDAVNRAARLESLAKPYGVTIAADETIAEKATKLNWKLLGTDVLRGRSTESRIYSISTN
jgi:class 3 adenylate cyclase